ncbi:MAG: hypothetical protein IH591_17125 [Bacteroidales bacterium]|nr:hypothetical protein [Bacteroidales bacterium]
MQIRRVILSGVIIIFAWVAADAQSGIYDAVLRSQALRKSGNASGAVEIVSKVIISNPDYRLYNEMGEGYLILENYTDAKKCFNDASDIMPASGSFGLARVYAATGNKTESLKYLRENLASAFRMEEKVYHLDPYLGRIENSREWMDFWSKDPFTDAEKLLAEVMYQIGLGRIKDAARIIDESRQQLGSDPEFIYSEAMVKFADGLYPEVVGMLKSLPPGNVTAGMREVLLADALLAMGDYSASLAGYSRMIEAEYPDPRMFLGRARSYLGLTEYGKSLNDIDYYISIYPDDVQAIGLAGSVAAASGEINRSLVYMNRAIEIDPNLRNSYAVRGDIWSSAGMWNNAVSDYSMALDLDPADGNIYFSKGVALIKLGKTEQACFDFRMALRYGNRKASEMINIHCIK